MLGDMWSFTYWKRKYCTVISQNWLLYFIKYLQKILTVESNLIESNRSYTLSIRIESVCNKRISFLNRIVTCVSRCVSNRLSQRDVQP